MSKKKVTMKDIATLAEVSPSTVSRVLNYDDSLQVTKETKQKIFEIAQELSYRTIKKEKQTDFKEHIGIWYSLSIKQEVEDVYYLSLRLAVEKYFQNQKITLHWFKEKPKVTQVKQFSCVFLIGQTPDTILRFFKTYHVPLISLDENLITKGIPSVVFDFSHAVNTIYDFFKEKGHTRLGFIGGKDVFTDQMDLRQKEWEKRIKKEKRYHQEWVKIADFTPQSGYHLFKEMMQDKNHRPTAIFIANDSMAVGCYKAAQELNISIPKEVSLIGFNNISSAQFLSPALTTVELDVSYLVEMGDWLLERIRTKKMKKPFVLILPTTLIERESTQKK